MYLIGLDFKFNGLDDEDVKLIVEHMKLDLGPEAKGVKTRAETPEELLKGILVLTQTLPGVTFFVVKETDHNDEEIKDSDESL